MNVIQPNCRAQFTAQDVEFVLEVLGRKLGTAECLVKLLADEDSRDLILDDESLFHALLERRGCLRVSCRFYFYVLVRRVFKRADLNDRSVADYVAEFWRPSPNRRGPNASFPAKAIRSIIFLKWWRRCKKRMTGRVSCCGRTLAIIRCFCPAFPRAHPLPGGVARLPGSEILRGTGPDALPLAGEHRLAQRYHLEGVLRTLSERFQATRRALNEMADRLLFVGEPDVAIPLLLADHDAGAGGKG